MKIAVTDPDYRNWIWQSLGNRTGGALLQFLTGLIIGRSRPAIEQAELSGTPAVRGRRVIACGLTISAGAAKCISQRLSRQLRRIA